MTTNQSMLNQKEEDNIEPFQDKHQGKLKKIIIVLPKIIIFVNQMQYMLIATILINQCLIVNKSCIFYKDIINIF